MRLLISCMTCLQERGRPSDWFAQVEFRDDGRYEVQCPNGHRTVTLLQAEKYEVLFEIAIHAILDGYYREAVASFAASLERFYEFAIAVLLEDLKVKRDDVEAAWKHVSNQSERQLGGFLYLWMSRFKGVPQLLSPDDAGFRNAVVHKGKIPSKDEATAFGQSVLEVVVPKLAQIKQQLHAAMLQVTFYSLRSKFGKGSQEQVQPCTMGLNTAYQRAVAHEQLTVRAYLEHMAGWRFMQNASVPPLPAPR